MKIITLLLTTLLFSCFNKAADEGKKIATNKPVKDTAQSLKPRTRKEKQLAQPKPKIDLNEEMSKVKKHFESLTKYINEKQYDNAHVIIINMRIPSYLKRLFVYDIAQQTIVSSALVSHGQGSVGDDDTLKFSNIPESKMSSIGKYAIANAYYGTYGFAYRLHGLDATNSKAMERNIVLHSYVDVPDEETDQHIVLSSGCPMVSVKYMQTLKKYIKQKDKKTILSIIY